jgi:hypothetical protein
MSFQHNSVDKAGVLLFQAVPRAMPFNLFWSGDFPREDWTRSVLRIRIDWYSDYKDHVLGLWNGHFLGILGCLRFVNSV